MECGSQGVRTPPGFERGESPLFSCLKPINPKTQKNPKNTSEKLGFGKIKKKFQKQGLNHPLRAGDRACQCRPRRAASPTVSGFQRFFAKFEISEKPLKIGDYYRGLFGGYLGVI